MACCTAALPTEPILSLDDHIFTKSGNEKVSALISSLLGFFNVITNGLVDLNQEGFKLKPVHGIHQVHSDELIRIEMLELRSQPLDENIEINLLAETQAIPENLYREEWHTRCRSRLGIELNIGESQIIFPKVVIEQSQVRPECRPCLFNPRT